MLGEGVNLFSVPTPRSLRGKALAETGIGAQTGMTVIALQQNGSVTTELSAETVLSPDDELVMLGGSEQRRDFAKLFGA